MESLTFENQGTIEPATSGNNYVIKGVYEEIDDGYRVTELPVRTWTQVSLFWSINVSSISQL